MVRILENYTLDISVFTRVKSVFTIFDNRNELNALKIYVELNLIKDKLQTRVASYTNPPDYSFVCYL